VAPAFIFSATYYMSPIKVKIAAYDHTFQPFKASRWLLITLSFTRTLLCAIG